MNADIIPIEDARAPARTRDLTTTLERSGVTRSSLVRQLKQIALTGEKVTTTYKHGVEVQRKVTHDPALQMQAVDRLMNLIDKAEGLSKRKITYEEY